MASLFVFDIDGTVLDSVGAHQAAFLKALESFGFNAIDTDWDSYLHHTDSWIFAQTLRKHTGREPTSFDLERLDCLIAQFIGEQSTSALAVTEGFEEFVSGMVEAGHAVAFATGSMRRATLAKLRLARLDLDAPLVTASEHFERQHIVAAAVREVARGSLEDAFDRVVCFGDGRWDFAAAEALGFEFIGITAFSAKLTGLLPAELLHASFRSVSLARHLSPTLASVASLD